MGQVANLVRRTADRIEQAVRAEMHQTAREVVQHIKRRTRSGRSATGAPFRRLSRSYARREGRTQFKPESIVQALRFDKIKDGYRISVRPGPRTRTGQSVRDVGGWHQVGKPGRRTKTGTPNPLPKRTWMGVSRAQTRRMSRDLGLRASRRVPDEKLQIRLTIRL